MSKEETRSVAEIAAGWNPPAQDSGFESVVGVAVPDGDTRATAALGSVPPPETDDEDGGYAAMSKKELQDELERRELPKSGKVAELIERLEEHDAELAEGDDDEDDEDDGDPDA